MYIYPSIKIKSSFLYSLYIPYILFIMYIRCILYIMYMLFNFFRKTSRKSIYHMGSKGNRCVHRQLISGDIKKKTITFNCDVIRTQCVYFSMGSHRLNFQWRRHGRLHPVTFARGAVLFGQKGFSDLPLVETDRFLILKTPRWFLNWIKQIWNVEENFEFTLNHFWCYLQYLIKFDIIDIVLFWSILLKNGFFI